MLLRKEQISEQMRKHTQKKKDLHDLMEIMLESMMVAERGEFLSENPGNKGETATVPARPMVKARNWSSVFHVTDTATYTRKFWPFCAIRKKNATAWRASSTPKA